jgi:hypothetical protein
MLLTSNHYIIILLIMYLLTGGKRYQHNQTVASNIYHEWPEIQ